MNRVERSDECVGARLGRVNGRAEPLNLSLSKVSAAERRVLGLVSLAKTNKEIALALNVSPATVKRHLENILKKLELKNRVEAAIVGLMIAGCPKQSGPDCPLRLWRREKAFGAGEWAV